MPALEPSSRFQHRDHSNHAGRVTTRLLPLNNAPVEVSVHVPQPPRIFANIVQQLADQSRSSAISARLERIAGQLQQAFIA
jgi:hypothetical protein